MIRSPMIVLVTDVALDPGIRDGHDGIVVHDSYARRATERMAERP